MTKANKVRDLPLGCKHEGQPLTGTSRCRLKGCTQSHAPSIFASLKNAALSSLPLSQSDTGDTGHEPVAFGSSRWDQTQAVAVAVRTPGSLQQGLTG